MACGFPRRAAAALLALWMLAPDTRIPSVAAGETRTADGPRAVASVSTSPDAEAVFCNDDTPISPAHPLPPPDGSLCHQDIVRSALDFLRPWPLSLVVKHVRDPDDIPWPNKSTAPHFDDCNFDGGAERINARYLGERWIYGVVPGLSPKRRQLPRPAVGAAQFRNADLPEIENSMVSWASALHGVQDFYSHSNWAEMTWPTPATEVDLVDERLRPWRVLPPDWPVVHADLGDGYGDVLASQRDLPPGWRLITPRRFVPVVIDRTGTRHHVLVSGEAGSRSEKCPDGADFDHDDDLNKDDIKPPKHAAQTGAMHLRAESTAVRQTQHEWCRLLHMERDRNGPDGAAVLFGLLADPRKNPHPEGTPCAAPPGPLGVTIAVTDIEVLNDHEDGEAGQLTLVLSAFTAELTRSKASQADTVRIEARRHAPAAKLPRAVTLCVQPTDRVFATLQGWEDDGDDGRAALTDGDDLLSGVTVDFGPASGLRAPPLAARLTGTSVNGHVRDLRVSFKATAGRGAVTPACGDPQSTNR